MTTLLVNGPAPNSATVADPLRGRDILCFSHDWGGDPLSKNHLMRLLARDNRILWVNSIGYRAPTASRGDLSRALGKLRDAAGPIREPEPNLFVLNPLAVPAFGSRWVRALNRLLLRIQVKWSMSRLGFQRPINWVFNPAAAVVAGHLDEDAVIYHCVDEYTAFTGVPAAALADLERQLLRRADLVLVSSERLYQSKAGHNPATFLLHHGVDFEHFRAALDPETRVPESISRLPKPVLGFFGLIADWVDVGLLAAVADRFSGGSLVLLGKTTTDVSALECRPNVHMPGRVPYGELPAYCKGFDVALLPFRINELTLSASPLKFREYLAAGLPVVSTPVPEVEALGLARVAADPDSFVREIEAALADPGPSVERSESVRDSGWAARLDEIRGHLAALRAAPAPPLGLFSTIAGDLRRKALWLYQSVRWQALLKVLFADGTAAMIVYRLMQWSRRYRLVPLEMVFNKLNAVGSRCVIGRGADFGPGFVLVHADGVVINGAVRGGSNVSIEHQVTIGADARRGCPRLEDDVFLGAGAKVFGAISVGTGARIGANAVVVHDVPAHATVVGVPARVVRQLTPTGGSQPPRPSPPPEEAVGS